jgi:hypothetical protein
MPLMVAKHCSRVVKPQFVASRAPPYSAHQGYSTAWAGGGANAAVAESAASASRVFRIVSSLVIGVFMSWTINVMSLNRLARIGFKDKTTKL